jgi:hypothetical protein
VSQFAAVTWKIYASPNNEKTVRYQLPRMGPNLELIMHCAEVIDPESWVGSHGQSAESETLRLQ